MEERSDYAEQGVRTLVEQALKSAEANTAPRGAVINCTFPATEAQRLSKAHCEFNPPLGTCASASTKPVIGESLARGLISRWRKNVRAEYTSVHSDVMDDYYYGHRKRSQSLRATEVGLRALTYALLHLEKKGRHGKAELHYALIQTGRLRTDPQFGIQVIHIDSRGRTSSRTLSISLTEHYLIRVIQAKRCRTVEEVRDAAAEIMIHYLKFNDKQEHEVSPPDRYQDDRMVWMVTMAGAHLTKLKNGLPSFAITYLPRESWDPRREADWAGVSSSNPMIISDQI